MSNADMIVEILQKEGVEFLCGFPNNRLFNAAASHDIRPIIALRNASRSIWLMHIRG